MYIVGQIIPNCSSIICKAGANVFPCMQYEAYSSIQKVTGFCYKCKGYIFFYILFKALDIKVFISILTKTAVKLKKQIIRIKPHVRNSQSFKELHISSVILLRYNVLTY